MSTSQRSVIAFLCLLVVMATRWGELITLKVYLQISLVSPAELKSSERIGHNDFVATSGFHFCQKGQLHHQNQTMQLLYQCNDKSYINFAQKLHELVSRLSLNRHTSASWGKRKYPLPSDTTVLLLGNSHLRQISKTLACQYESSIESMISKGPEFFSIRFSNNSTLVSVTNTVLVHSKKWTELIEKTFLHDENRTLHSVDAIVFGKFTKYNEAKATNYAKTMMAEEKYYNQIINSSGILDYRFFPPPELVNVARLFSIPIISTSMFAVSDQQRADREYREFQEIFPHRINVPFVDSRAYIDFLGLECGSDDKWEMGGCHEVGDFAGGSTRSPANMHRCAGKMGGHADLIAWDIIEHLNENLEE